MSEPTSADAPRRRRERKPAGARRSMLVYLVALVIVPALGMPVFATLFSRDRLDDASAARRIADGMEQVVEFEDLRSNLRDEALEAGIRSIAVRFGISIEDLQPTLQDFPIRSLEESRQTTDAAIARLRDGGQGATTLTQLTSALDNAREVVDESLAGPVGDADAVWRVYLRYNAVYELISDGQRESLRLIVVGHYGDASRDVLEAVSETSQSLEVAELLFKQMSALQGMATAPSPAEQSELLAQIESDRRSSTTLTDRVPDLLSDAGVRDWERLMSEPEFAVFDEFLVFMIEGGLNLDDAPTGDGQLLALTTPGFAEAGTAVIPVSESIGELMGRSVDRGVRAAESDHAHAVSRARVAVIATAGLLVVTCALLVLVGGSMRRELNHLASAAGQLRSGRLAPVPVEGPREIASVAEALNDAVANLRSVSQQAEMLAAGQLDELADQEPVPGELGTAVHASITRVVDVVRELDRLQTELIHQAAHDQLTGLANRAEGERILAEAVERAGSDGHEVAVLFVDLDDFKAINDTLGHAGGDHVLITVAERMAACMRPTDTLCRLGGDEFLVILDGAGREVGIEGATRVAERIRDAVADPIRLHGVTIVAGASIGIASTTESTDPAVLRARADTAMYRAKATGSNGVQVYDAKLDASGLPRRRFDGTRRSPTRGPGGGTESVA